MGKYPYFVFWLNLDLSTVLFRTTYHINDVIGCSKVTIFQKKIPQPKLLPHWLKEIRLYFYFTSKFKIFSEYQCLYLPTGIALQGQANKKSNVGKIIFDLKIRFLSESN